MHSKGLGRVTNHDHTGYCVLAYKWEGPKQDLVFKYVAFSGMGWNMEDMPSWKYLYEAGSWSAGAELKVSVKQGWTCDSLQEVQATQVFIDYIYI